MRLRRNRRFHAEVATGSLNDIMFFLMLFFLIVSTVANPNVIKILLPKSQANQALSKKTVSLTVTEDKHYFINQREIDFLNLEAEILNEQKNVEDLTVVLRLPANLQIQDMVDVMQIGAKHHIKMVLATDKK
ncbi:MAG: biopolymer transporter ExbD [Bacteroidota bacterium]